MSFLGLFTLGGRTYATSKMTCTSPFYMSFVNATKLQIPLLIMPIVIGLPRLFIMLVNFLFLLKGKLLWIKQDCLTSGCDGALCGWFFGFVIFFVCSIIVYRWGLHAMSHHRLCLRFVWLVSCFSFCVLTRGQVGCPPLVGVGFLGFFLVLCWGYGRMPPLVLWFLGLIKSQGPA